MNKTFIWILILIVLIGGGFLLLRQDTPTDTGEGPIKVGVIGPLTGDAAVYGEPMRDAVLMAVDEINESGGINGRSLEVIYEDGQCGGTGAANAAQKLINVDKVKAIIGGFCSSESFAAIPIAEKAGVFIVSPGSSNPDLTGISPLFVRTWVSDAAQGGELAETAYNLKNWRKVAFIVESLDYPIGIFNAFSTRFKELGGTVVKEEFPSDTTDFRTVLTKLRTGNPDALFISVQASPAAERILRQLDDLGWDPPLLVADVVPGDPNLVANNAELLEGAIGAAFFVDTNDPKVRTFIDNYVERYGSEPPYADSYTPNVYDTVFMLAQAIEEVGYSPEKISEWFRGQTNWPGISGPIGINEGGDRTGGFVLKVIKNGKTEVLSQ